MFKSGQVFDGSMDIINASSAGDYGAVDRILKHQLEDVNKVNASGWTALMYAANYGHYHILRLLIRYNASVDQRDWQGRTALMLAATNGHTRSIDVLLNFGGADKNLKDLSGINAYQYAKNCGHGNNKLIKSLLLVNSRQSHEVRGRSLTTGSDQSVRVIPSIAVNGDNDQKTCIEAYNPYERTAFSSSIWKPINSQLFKDFLIPGKTGLEPLTSSSSYLPLQD